MGFRIYTCGLFLTIALFFAVSPRAASAEVERKPVVLMLLLEQEEIKPLQERFKDELALELETHTLSVKPAFHFSSDNLSARIEEIRKIASVDKAEAVIWLEKINTDTVSLQLVVVAPGQSTVRSVEARMGADMEGALAIATRDLLHDIRIHLKEPENRPEVPPQTPSEPDADRPAAPKPGMFNLSVGVDVAGGFMGNAESPILLGGFITVGGGRMPGIIVDLSLCVFAAPSPQVSGGVFHTFGIRPGVGVGYLWGTGFLNWGPYLGVQVPWQRASAALNNFPASEDSWWNLRIVPSLDLRLRVHRNVLILLRPGLAVHVKQEVFERASDRATVYTSPYLDWNVTAGIIFHFI